MKKFFGFIFNKWTLLVLGLLALSLLIWFVGPLIAIGSLRPLDPEWARWTLIGLIVLFFIVRRAWAIWKARRASDQMAASLAAQSVGPTEKAGDKEVAVLDARFKEALETLKKSNLSGAKWNQRFGSGYLYHLPWYMFIGAPGSGKTTSLLNSGLEFPLAEKFGKEAIRGVGGTRNCDWWFTNEAILLDTAGRYTTQTSNKEEDAGAWQGFLQLLRKARPRRPINGILLTISIQDLLSQAQPDRERHGTTLRQRVQELYSQLGLRIPIYVLVTKTDLLPGFMEYFESLGKEERAQVLGFTLPFKETQNGLDRANLGSTYSREFAAIEKRLFDGLIDRLEAERDPQRRALVYGFPEQFAGIRDVLGEFLVHTFAASNFDDAPLIRGVYFTSGTQEDTPIDRIMGLLARSFKVERRVLPSRTSTGRSYFITKLLKDVVFAESELAGTNLKWERRRSIINAAAMALICLVGVATVTAWAFSFVRNKEYLANVATKVPDVTKTVTGFDNVATTDVLQVLPALEELRRVAIAPPVDSDFSSPTSMKFGLFQGDKIDAAAQAAYQRLLTDAFLPRVALRIEEILRKTQADNPELMYEALKAYLMMHDTENYSADALKAIILADWQDSLPRGVTVDQRQALERHLIALLDRGIVVSPLPMDKTLVENARTTLARLSLPQRVYSRMKRLGVGSEFPEFNAVRAGGPNISNIFTRASGAPMTRGPAGMFSYDGYYSGFLKQVDIAAQQLAAEERWVMGLNDQQRQFNLNDANAKLNLSKEVRRIYLDEYAREWKKYLADIRLRKIKDLNDAIAVTQVLSSVDSPMRSLFRAVAKETTLSEKLDGGRIDKALNESAREVDKAREALGKIFSQDRQAAGPSTGETLEQQLVDNQFRDIRAWVKAPTPGQPAQIDESVRLLGELYTFMQQVRTAVGS
ncbi:MAG TPA: type VI secretion system membrane subunit TssM, partial [Burkholderiaceae bacterium]|nr:type VI secretion system membrane subunit TssM [Burkholderiaceae bacterium]